MGIYDAKHTKLLSKMSAKEAVEITFTRSVPGVFDPVTEQYAPPTVHEFGGLAIEIPADPEEYQQLELIVGSNITLFFVPHSGLDTSEFLMAMGAGIYFTQFLPVFERAGVASVFADSAGEQGTEYIRAGGQPLPGDQVTWAERPWTVRATVPYRPNGEFLAAKVMCG
jgi:hypothetical protein